MPEENTLADLIKMPLVAFAVIIIVLIGTYSGMAVMISSFAASLFMILLREGSEFAHFKNVLGGHLIGFACAFITPSLIDYITFIPENIATSILIGISVLIAGWLMAITRLEHPPAIGTTVIFFGTQPEGYLILGVVPIWSLVGFLIGLGVVALAAFLTYKNKR